jgi:hypothetical protein
MRSRYISDFLAIMLVCAGSLRAQGVDSNQKCSRDKANVRQLENQLQEDLNWLKKWCGGVGSPANSNTECQQVGPGMNKAVKLLNEEISAALLQVSKDCAPPPPPPPPPPAPPLSLTITDVSPDAPFGSAPDSVDQAGRINSLVIDPHNDSVLYAAAEMSGVWKSQDGGQSWRHSSVGLRTGLTQNNFSLAVDDQNSQRLVYATGDDDGRAVRSYGGLWVSNNAGGNWQYGNLQCGGISSVVFSTGQPFVGTLCGIYTTTSQNLASATWQRLPQGTFNGKGAVLAAAGRQSLFACQGNQVFRSLDLGMSWGNPITIAGSCSALAVAPLAGETQASMAITLYATSVGQQEVALLNLETGSQLPALGFSAYSLNVNGISGRPNVYAPRIASAAPSAVLPGAAYDIYAGDGCSWFAFNAATFQWNKLQGGGSGCSSGIHVDTWAMAFTSNYDPPNGKCGVYASTDGGVFANRSTQPVVSGGCISGWVTAQSGLHAMYTGLIGGLTGSPPSQLHLLPPIIYLPTGDNDVWMGSLGGAFWTPFHLLGDAGQAWIDSLLPGQVLLARNGTYDIVANPPAPNGTVTGLAPQFPSEGAGLGEGNLSQVMTLLSETPPAHGDYVSVWIALWYDVVARNVTDQNPPSNANWKDLSPNDHFLSTEISKIQCAGGHSGLNVYVMTNPSPGTPHSASRGSGQIWRGQVGANGVIPQWTPAYGSGSNILKQAANFVVNPYDPSEIYAADLGDQKIKISHDYGQTWHVQQALTDIATVKDPATNQPAFRFDCFYFDNLGNPAIPGRGTPTGFFANACALADVAFDRNHPNIRVAALYPGGLAFSPDAGATWIPLDVTDANPATANDLMELPISVFYDGESASNGTATIYLALRGPSLKAVTGPFPTLQ